MTTTSTMHVLQDSHDFCPGPDSRLLSRAAQFAQTCAHSAARAARAIARRHRMRRDLRQLMSMSEHRLKDIGLSRAEIGNAVRFYVHR
ncbi:MAG TPA: DUF1127 domain-containing protein [Geminicoccaceae bacterium]|nr:DUF1127 domain-containing protein [Geminicoccaceae bacterium]